MHTIKLNWLEFNLTGIRNASPYFLFFLLSFCKYFYFCCAMFTDILCCLIYFIHSISFVMLLSYIKRGLSLPILLHTSKNINISFFHMRRMTFLLLNETCRHRLENSCILKKTSLTKYAKGPTVKQSAVLNSY